MMKSEKSEVFYSGSYFLIRPNYPDWEQLESELISKQLISLSNCICPRFNVSWGWTTGNIQLALDFGIAQSRLAEFVQWCRTEYKENMDIWSMFYTPNDARQFVNRFTVNQERLYIVGTALPQSIEVVAWQESSDDVYGIEKHIEQHFLVESGGKSLGFEIVSFEYGNYGHSWLCHYLHEDAHRLFGIRPNEHGLFETFEDAMMVLKWIESGGDGGRAHHPPYDVWQLLSYPLEANNPP